MHNMKEQEAELGNLRSGIWHLATEQGYVYTLPSQGIVIDYLRVGDPAGIYIPHLKQNPSDDQRQDGTS